jgi:hypothetical protein
MTLLESNMKSVSPQCYNSNINKRKADIMSATTYSIEDLLVGTFYQSRSFARKGKAGVIQSAEKREGIYYHNAEAYLVRVRPTHQFDKPSTWDKDFYATVCVATD